MAEPLTLAMLAGLQADASGYMMTSADREAMVKQVHEITSQAGLGPLNVAERLVGFLGEALQKPVAGIVGEVWNQRKEMREMAQPGKVKKDVEANVALFDHSVSCAVHPSVSVLIDGTAKCTLTFDAKVELKLKGAQVVIRNACITAIKGGTLTSTISVEYKTIPVCPPVTRTLDMAARFELPGGGIKLG